MRINSNQPPDGQKKNHDDNNMLENMGNSEARSKVVSGPTLARTDKMEILSKNKEVTDLMVAINRMPGVRMDKIKAVQDSLASGTYVIDSRNIAEKILQEI